MELIGDKVDRGLLVFSIIWYSEAFSVVIDNHLVNMIDLFSHNMDPVCTSVCLCIGVCVCGREPEI